MNICKMLLREGRLPEAVDALERAAMVHKRRVASIGHVDEGAAACSRLLADCCNTLAMRLLQAWSIST